MEITDKEKCGGFYDFGSSLIALGKKFQNPDTTINDLLTSCMDLGIILSFKIEPDPNQSVDTVVEPVIGE